MTGFFKLFADVSVYYALILFLASVILGVDYFAAGWFFLVLMCACCGLERERHSGERASYEPLFYAVPLLSLLFHPSLLQIAGIVPVWAYCIYIWISSAFDMTCYEFKKLCGKECIALFLVYLSFFFLPRWPEAMTGACMYLAFALCAMVCGLRWFRQERSGGGITLAMMGALVSVSALAAFFHVFSFIGSFVKNLYLRLVNMLFSIGGSHPLPVSDNNDHTLPDAALPGAGGDPLPSDPYHEPSFIAEAKAMSVFEKILIILLILLIILAVCLILFRTMKAHRYVRREEADEITEKIPPKKKAKRGLFAPGDPREAVRWYYAKYVHECAKKGIPLTDTMTSEEIRNATGALVDADTAERFRTLYIQARYSSRAVTKADAEEAREYWRIVKSGR